MSKTICETCFIAFASCGIVASPCRGQAPAPAAQFRGFGELQLVVADYPENFYRDRYSGPQRDRRASLDLSKLALEGSRPIGAGVVFEAEVSVRHQGISGSSQPNYGGPFNDEHHGAATEGGVELTKALLAKRIGESVAFYGGRIPVAFGLLTFTDTPMDYLGSRPYRAELDLIPEEWTELGVAANAELGSVVLTSEVVNGLDSTGFTTYRFVAEGRQGRYGSVRVTEPAAVERAELVVGEGAKVGAAVYYGETSQNRPTADMARTCDDSERVASCGYVHAPLTLAEAHATLVRPRLRGSALAIWGHLRNAAQVNLANEKNRTNSPELYSPVAERVFSLALEAGLNLAGQPETSRIEPFFRYERLSTAWKTAHPSDASPLGDRRRFGGGLAWQPNAGFYAKIDYERQIFHDEALSYESELAAVSGFRF